MVDKKPDRQLRRDRQDVGDRQRKAELDKADAECRLQKREQRRQDEVMEMIDEMRRRDDADGAVFPALLAPFATTPIIAGARDGCRVRVISALPPGTVLPKISAATLTRQAPVRQ